MKKTGELKIGTITGIGPDRFRINPNDAFDLGLMMQEHAVVLCADAAEFQDGGKGSPAVFELRNECPSKCLEMNAKTWKDLGKPDAAIVLYEDGKVFIQPASKR